VSFPTVPIATNGLEGWTSCCSAATTFSGDGAFCCKGCWEEVDPLALEGEKGAELGRVIDAVIREEISSDEGVRRQQKLLAAAGEDEYGAPTTVTGFVIDLSEFTEGSA
jgi:hypothetical protein